jgi:hypothetical protein
MKNRYKLTESELKIYWKNVGISFFILSILVMANAFIKELCGIKWANPIMEMTILLLVPVLYGIIANSLIRPPSSLRFNATVTISVSLLIGVLLLVGNKYNAFKLIENNMISNSIWGILYLSAYDVYFIACIVRILFRKKN